jgi:hypothetical protein
VSKDGVLTRLPTKLIRDSQDPFSRKSGLIAGKLDIGRVLAIVCAATPTKITKTLFAEF